MFSYLRSAAMGIASFFTSIWRYFAGRPAPAPENLRDSLMSQHDRNDGNSSTQRIVSSVQKEVNATPPQDRAQNQRSVAIDIHVLAEEKKAKVSMLKNLSKKNNHDFFHMSDLINIVLDYSHTDELIQLVAGGEQDKAEKLINVIPELLARAGTVTDLAGRTFPRITAFQYALWAGDWHMFEMLVKHLPKDEARQQFQHLEDKGVEYTYADKKEEKAETERQKHHFSLQPLLEAYALLKQAIQADNWDRARGIWVKQVGGAQARVPVCIANQYCHPHRHFGRGKDTDFSGPLPRSLTLDEGDKWYTAADLEGKIGESFVVGRGPRRRRRGEWFPGSLALALDDSASVHSLSDVRAAHLNALAAPLGVTISQESSSSPRPK